MSSPPRKPPGPPPARNPPPDAPDLKIKRPAGPPPGAAAVPLLAAIKPPPLAPPPSNLQQQSAQRPAVDGAKHTDPLQSLVGKRPLEAPPADAAPKKTAFGSPPPQQKAGAISMFEQPDPSTTAAASANTAAQQKGFVDASPPRPFGARPPRALPPQIDGSGPMIRQPRPPPPRANPPGIPDGQPLPPKDKPVETKRAPPPVRPPPLIDGHRAPPALSPEEEEKQRLLALQNAKPPTTEPPLLRVKKVKEEKALKRREREQPEFENSDDDEDDEEATRLVKQPLPFGVLKGQLPKPASVIKAEEEKEEEELQLKRQQMATAAAAQLSDSTPQKKEVPVPTIEPPSVLRPPSSFTPQPPASTASVVSTEMMSVGSPPPITMDKAFDDSNLGKSGMLKPGRLSIRCLEGIDIRRAGDKDKNPRLDPFLKMKLGAAERHPWKATAVKRKQDSNPKFDNEIVYFDLVDPRQFVLEEDISLSVQLWHKGNARDEMVCSVSMSVLRFFKTPYTAFTERLPLYYPGSSQTSRSPMKLVLEIVFEEARPGLALLTFYEAHGLRSIDPLGQQDPFVQCSLGMKGSYVKRTKSVKGGGTDPYFEEDSIAMWLDGENWSNDLTISILDEDSKEDKPIGYTTLSLLPYMKYGPDTLTDDKFDLFYEVLVDPKDSEGEKKEIPCGEISMSIRFLPAGQLDVLIQRATNLTLPENAPLPPNTSHFDPFVQLTLEGKAVSMIKRTPADKDGGKDPVWNSLCSFSVVDQASLDLQVFHQGGTGSVDTLIGFTTISLLPTFRNGVAEQWVSIKQRKATSGGIKEAGDVLIKLSFVGPPGVSYPQLRQDVDTFDEGLRKAPGDTLRVQGGNEYKEENDQPKQAISTIPTDDDNLTQEQLAERLQSKMDNFNKDAKPEFTEAEIAAAFRFIDLDHNNFVGAAEIRHILVCMGEMITDEEIDMMISMVDMDGDGQVSFKEFRALVLHPNPGLADMHKEINRDKESDMLRDKQAVTGKTSNAAALDLSSFQRQKELLQREAKKKMLLAFIDDNELTFDAIRQAHTSFIELPLDQRPGGRLKFETFAQVMRVEPIAEYRQLHSLYDDEEMGDMDLREFLLSLMNFVAVEKAERIRQSFEMFDEGKTGFIGQSEVEEILRGNHMLSLSSVKKKAETVMRQARAANTAGAITLKEFLVVAQKFPNILFPTAGIAVKGGATVAKPVSAAASTASSAAPARKAIMA